MTDTTSAPLDTIENWAAKHSEAAGPGLVWLAVAKLTQPGWGVGKQVTESDFLAAMAAAGNLTILGG